MRVILLIISLLFAYGYHLVTGWYPDVAWIQDDFMSLVWPAFAAFLSIVTILFVSLHKKLDPVQGAWGIMALVGCMLVVPLIFAREQQANADLAARSRIEHEVGAQTVPRAEARSLPEEDGGHLGPHLMADLVLPGAIRILHVLRAGRGVLAGNLWWPLQGKHNLEDLVVMRK